MITETKRSTVQRLAAVTALFALSVACGLPPAAATTYPAVDLVLAVDNSKATASVDTERRLSALFAELVGDLGPDARVGLVAFDDLAEPLVALTPLADGGADQVNDALRTLTFSARQSNGAAGLERAIYELTQATDTDARRIVLLQQSAPIDVGAPEKDRAFRRWAMEVLTDKAADASIELWVVSLGPRADLAMGTALAEKTGGLVVESDSSAELLQAIRPFRERLTQPPPVSRLAYNRPDAPAGAAIDGPVIDAAPTPVVADLRPAAVNQINTSAAPAPAVIVEERAPRTALTIDELNRLPEPAAGPAVALAKAEQALAGGIWTWTPDWDWQLSTGSLHPSDWQAAGIATLILILIVSVFWYAWRLWRNDPPAATVADVPADSARLIDVSGITGRSHYRLGGKLARISRAPGQDTDNVLTVHIPEDVISRSHAFIELRRGAYWVTDPGSNNGTFVNDERINGSRELKHGDHVKFATYEFRFECVKGRKATGAPGALEGAAGDRTVAIGPAHGIGEAATTVYAGGGAGNRTTLAPQRGRVKSSGANGADADQDPTIVRPAG